MQCAEIVVGFLSKAARNDPIGAIATNGMTDLRWIMRKQLARQLRVFVSSHRRKSTLSMTYTALCVRLHLQRSKRSSLHDLQRRPARRDQPLRLRCCPGAWLAEQMSNALYYKCSNIDFRKAVIAPTAPNRHARQRTVSHLQRRLCSYPRHSELVQARCR